MATDPKCYDNNTNITNKSCASAHKVTLKKKNATN